MSLVISEANSSIIKEPAIKYYFTKFLKEKERQVSSRIKRGILFAEENLIAWPEHSLNFLLNAGIGRAPKNCNSYPDAILEWHH